MHAFLELPLQNGIAIFVGLMSDENSKPKRQSVKNALERIRKKAWKTTLARLTLKECTIPAIWIWAWDDASSGRYQIIEMHRPTELPRGVLRVRRLHELEMGNAILNWHTNGSCYFFSLSSLSTYALSLAFSYSVGPVQFMSHDIYDKLGELLPVND